MEDLKSRKWRGRFFRYAPLLFWICFIFFLSSPQASASETSRFIKPLIDLLFPHASPEAAESIHMAIRKAAHITEYAILAFLAIRACAGSGLSVLRSYRFWAAILLVAAVASCDEINQSMEASRTGAVSDVILDIFGGTLMLMALLIIKRPKLRFEP